MINNIAKYTNMLVAIIVTLILVVIFTQKLDSLNKSQTVIGAYIHNEKEIDFQKDLILYD